MITSGHCVLIKSACKQIDITNVLMSLAEADSGVPSSQSDSARCTQDLVELELSSERSASSGSPW